MEINTQLAKMAAKSVGVAFDEATGLVNEKPGKLLKLLYAFGPDGLVNYVASGRLRLSQLKMQEALFDQCGKAVLENYAKLSKKLAGSGKVAEKLTLSSLLEQAEGDIRLLATVRRSLAHLPGEPPQEKAPQEEGEKADISWWSMFEDFARRPNEDWRVELLAKALAEGEKENGAIRLKALWEIGMLEADDFGALALFCDCAVMVDGKPLVVLDPEEQNEFVIDLGDGRQGNLAYVVADLVDRGLLQKSLTQFDTTEPVCLGHRSGPHYLHHVPPGAENYRLSAIQIAAYGPTDYTLDICRLYDVNSNEASDANYESLRSTLEEAAKTEEALGIVEFNVQKE